MSVRAVSVNGGRGRYGSKRRGSRRPQSVLLPIAAAVSTAVMRSTAAAIDRVVRGQIATVSSGAANPTASSI